MYLTVLMFLFLGRLSMASYHEQYRVPRVLSERTETYMFSDKEYVIQNLPVRWEDAQIICRGRHNGSLAILDNMDKAEFLAEAMSESQFTLDSIWVGARRSSAEDPEGYRWRAGSRVELRRTAGDVMHYREDEKTTPAEFHFPSWLNRTHVPVPEGGADCVALSRMFHDKPVFLDLACDVDRPFVCEKAAQSQVSVTEMKTVRCKSGLYHIYDGRMDWDQAAAYCVLGRMTLAHIVTMRCLRKLGITMLKSRPSIETAWIGARGELGKWAWIDDGKNIFTPSTFGDTEPGHWPPLRDSTTIKQNGCMQLDRHTSHSPVFMEARCERKMHFICYESKEGGQILRSSTETPSDDFYYYVLVKQKLFWSHAYDNCLKMKGILAPIENPDVVTQLLLLMGENQDLPIGHLWVSGRLNMSKDIASDTVRYVWYNPITGTKIPDKRSLEHPGDSQFIPPWLDDDYTTDNSCLNLDRENHLSGMIYGLPCDTPQYSVCMIDKSHLHVPVTKATVTENSTIPEYDITKNKDSA